MLLVASAQISWAAERPGWLGLGYENHARMDRGKVVSSWFFVRHVVPGGPAARAGLQRGDLITAIDGRPLRFASDRDAVIALARIRPQQRLRLAVARSDRKLELTLVAAQMSDEVWKFWQEHKAYLDRTAR